MRKFLCERLSAHSSESQWKQIVGKAIGESAYISQDQLRSVYTKAMKDISINGNGLKSKKFSELENALLDSQKRITSLETTNYVLRKTIDENKQENEDLKKRVDSIMGALKPLLERVDVIEKAFKQQEIEDEIEFQNQQKEEIARWNEEAKKS